MKIKIQKAKFIRNIIIAVIALIIVEFIVNIAPGFKRNKYQDVTNLVIGDENVTENLKNPIYIDEQNGIYISKEDIIQFLDKTFYYEEENNTIITTSAVSVASMKIGEKTININGAKNDTLYTTIYNNNIMYIPIQEMQAVYNIDVQYNTNKNVVIIDNLNEGMIKAEVDEGTKIRFKPRALSKKVGELEIGDVVSAFYTTSKGWRLIRTTDGIVGYVKANVLTNEYIVRQDMNKDVKTKQITTSISNNTYLELEEKKILIKDLLKISNEGILLKNTDLSNDIENVDIWANLELGNVDLGSYSKREKTIKNIVTIAMKNNIKGINLILKGQSKEERLVIELAPRLREIGIKTNIVTNDSINEETYIGTVNYIITMVK